MLFLHLRGAACPAFLGSLAGEVVPRTEIRNPSEAIVSNKRVLAKLKLNGNAMPLYGMSFTDALHGTVVGRGGIILRTTDGGERWERSTSGVVDNLYDVCFTNPYIGTAVGDNATILRTTTGGMTWLRDTQAAGAKHARQPNYPNPFTISTSIPIHLERTEQVSLRIFDAFGRDIATLHEGMLDAGTHTVTWQARGLPAGVYFAVLRFGAKSETSKLVLMDIK